MLLDRAAEENRETRTQFLVAGGRERAERLLADRTRFQLSPRMLGMGWSRSWIGTRGPNIRSRRSSSRGSLRRRHAWRGGAGRGRWSAGTCTPVSVPGVLSLDSWLIDYAPAADAVGSARTYVVVDEEPGHVVGYYALTAA